MAYIFNMIFKFPPNLDGTNISCWKGRIKPFIKSVVSKLEDIIVNGPYIPMNDLNYNLNLLFPSYTILLLMALVHQKPIPNPFIYSRYGYTKLKLGIGRVHTKNGYGYGHGFGYQHHPPRTRTHLYPNFSLIAFLFFRQGCDMWILVRRPNIPDSLPIMKPMHAGAAIRI